MHTSWPELSSFLGDVVVDAASAVLPHLGMADKEAVDRAAVNAIRARIAASTWTGRVVSCEGAKDGAPRFLPGEVLGPGRPTIDLAIDPVDGTSAAAAGRPGALVIVAAAPLGSVANLEASVYCDKLAVGPALAGVVDLAMPAAEIVAIAGKHLGRDPAIAVLDRPRNSSLIAALRKGGCQLILQRDADVAAALAAGVGSSSVDILLGVGGTPEALACAIALKCLGGNFQCCLWPRNQLEQTAVDDVGLAERILRLDELVGSECGAFAIAGVTETLPLGKVAGSSIPRLVGYATAEERVCRGSSPSV